MQRFLICVCVLALALSASALRMQPVLTCPNSNDAANCESDYSKALTDLGWINANSPRLPQGDALCTIARNRVNCLRNVNCYGQSEMRQCKWLFEAAQNQMSNNTVTATCDVYLVCKNAASALMQPTLLLLLSAILSIYYLM